MQRRASVFTILVAAVFIATPSVSDGKGPQQVEVTIDSFGLDGYSSAYTTTVVRYTLKNNGPSSDVVLDIRETATDPIVGTEPFMLRNGITARKLHLDAGETHEGRWILPMFQAYWMPGTKIWLRVLSGTGRSLGAARLPEPKQLNPSVVLAASEETAKKLQQEISWSPSDQLDSYAPRTEVAVVLGRPPTLWYEYISTQLVVLARSWSSMGADGQKALERWVMLGGRLVVLEVECPDHAKGPWPILLDSDGDGVRLGSGRVWLVGRDVDLAPWLQSKGLVNWYGALATTDNLNPGYLVHGYLMPSTWVLVGILLLIILLVGPVTHLTLARLGRREWVWVAVPVLCVALACVTYMISSGIKGDRTALELHHVVRSTEGTTEAVASTAIRALSSRKLLVSVGVEAQQPALVAGYAYMVSPFSNGVRARTVIHEQSLRIDGIGMERWSNHDTGIQSMVPSVPLSVKGTPTSLTITNMTPGPLHDVFIHTDSGWYAVAPSIAAGAVHEASGLEQGASNAFDISPSWQTRTELENLRMLLGSIRLPASNSYIEPGWVTIVAGCDPEGMPEITMRPAPEKTYVRSTCIWERYLPAGDQ